MLNIQFLGLVTMTKTTTIAIFVAIFSLSIAMTAQNVFAEAPGDIGDGIKTTSGLSKTLAGSSTINFDSLPLRSDLGTSLTLDGVSFSTTDRTLATGGTTGSLPNSLGAHVVDNDFNGDITIELPANTCASDIQFVIFNPPFSAEGFDVDGNLLHTITSSGITTEVFDFTGFAVHKVVIDGRFYAMDDLTFSPVSCSDPLDEILDELKEIWEAIMGIEDTVDRIETTVNNIESNTGSTTERVSVTVNLDDIKLKTGEVMVLLDTTNSGTLSTVHVAANLPCNDAGEPQIHVVTGVAGGPLSGVLTEAADNTGFIGPEKTCVFHDNVDAADLGHDITDVIIIHPDNHPDADKKDDKKHEKLKGVIVTITGTYN